MISLNDLTISNSPERILLRDASLTLPDNTLTALIGRNGCGKSTLLRVIAGLQKPLGGSVTINGVNPHKAPAAKLASTVAVVTTDAPRVANLTCRELASLGRAPYTGLFGRLSAADRQRVDRAIAAVGMDSFASRRVTSLSDGEMRRIMIARALVQDTPAILLDEPTSFLDVPGRHEICSLLAALARNEGKTILYSTHELEPALRMAGYMLLIDGARATLLPPAAMRAHPPFRLLNRLA